MTARNGGISQQMKSSLISIPELKVLSDEEILRAMQNANPKGEEYPMWNKIEGRFLREVRAISQATIDQP